MGRAERAARVRREYRLSVPGRILKATLGFLFAIPLLPLIFATLCYKRDQWPWDELRGLD